MNAFLMKADTVTALHLSPKSLNQSPIEHTRAAMTFCPFFYCLASEHLKLLYKFDRPHAYPKAAEIKFLLQRETTDVSAALQQAAVRAGDKNLHL